MSYEDQSHRFVITGEDPEGHPRTIILWPETDLVHGKVIRRVVVTLDATLRTAALLTVLRTEVTRRSGKGHTMTVCLPVTEVISIDAVASVDIVVWRPSSRWSAGPTASLASRCTTTAEPKTEEVTARLRGRFVLSPLPFL